MWHPRVFSDRVRMTELGDGEAAGGSRLPVTSPSRTGPTRAVSAAYRGRRCAETMSRLRHAEHRRSRPLSTSPRRSTLPRTSRSARPHRPASALPQPRLLPTHLLPSGLLSPGFARPTHPTPRQGAAARRRPVNARAGARLLASSRHARRAARRCCASCTPRPCRALHDRGQSASTTGPGAAGAPGARLVVDLDRHRAIDLLPDRSSATFEAWLRSHTDLEIVTRDRSTSYARAAQAVVPRAQQVADRWHLLLNARQMLERWLVAAHARLRALPVPLRLGGSRPRSRLPAQPHGPGLPRGRRDVGGPCVMREVQRRRAAGASIMAIARAIPLAPGTVRRYASTDGALERSERRIGPSQLDPWLHSS